MAKNTIRYGMPNEGCLVGAAYQKLVGGTQDALRNAGLDITVAEYMILRTLYDSDGLQQCEISSAVGKDKAATCRTVSALLKKRYVATEPVSHKCLKVWLTPEGRDIKPQIMEVASRLHAEMKRRASPEDLQPAGAGGIDNRKNPHPPRQHTTLVGAFLADNSGPRETIVIQQLSKLWAKQINSRHSA